MMKFVQSHVQSLIMSIVMISFPASFVQAHYVWMIRETSPEARLLVYFGESPKEQNYHWPERIDTPKVIQRTDGEPVDVELEPLWTDRFVGLRSKTPIPDQVTVESTVSYGVYHGSLLTYFVRHLPGTLPRAWPTNERSSSQRLDVSPRWNDEGASIELRVTYDGELLDQANVSMVHDGKAIQKRVTNMSGLVEFPAVPTGLLGFVVSFTDKQARGTFADESFSAAMYIATLTVNHSDQRAEHGDAKTRLSERSELVASSETSQLPSLPQPISSFGAASLDSQHYVMGGHTGKAHDHSRENLSGSFLTLADDSSTTWRDLPGGEALQGLALVADDKAIYRIGGMTAKNAPGEPSQLYSIVDVARFDPNLQKWSVLPSLPAGRSSHDAVVIDRTLYVVGGWTLQGDDQGDWCDRCLSIDLDHLERVWSELPPQDWQRRALAASHLQGKLIVIGGMDHEEHVSRRVDVYDPIARTWTRAQDFPGDGMNGFGVAACHLQKAVYASGSNGVLYRLDDLAGSWVEVARLQRPRFFHRLLTLRETTLIALGGASREGHLNDVEIIAPSK